jgi:hypothetical protein
MTLAATPGTSLTGAPAATAASDAVVASVDRNNAAAGATFEGAVGRLVVDEEPDDADQERLLAPLTLRTVAVGLEVWHRDHGVCHGSRPDGMAASGRGRGKA